MPFLFHHSLTLDHLGLLAGTAELLLIRQTKQQPYVITRRRSWFYATPHAARSTHPNKPPTRLL